ncbi:MAG: response regulator [Saprospirales bacterium]|nr:response regulator [Saprospirales bacterium]
MLLAGGLPGIAQSHLVNTREINTKAGLSHKEVLCITQDTNGIIWIGTPYGLNRYDGYEFQWFTKSQYALSGNQVTEILHGENGSFWLAHWENPGANRTYFFVDLFNPYTFEVSPWEVQLESNAPFAVGDIQLLKSMPDGRLIFSLKNGDAYAYSLSDGFRKQPFPKGFGLVDCFGEKDIWGVAGRNLLQISRDGEILHSYPLHERAEVKQIVRDHLGRHWVLLADAFPDRRAGYERSYIQVLENGKTPPVNLGKKFGFPETHILPLPEREVVLIFLNQEVFELDDNLKISYHHQSLSSNFDSWNTVNFFLDKNGLIWRGHREGLTLVDWQWSPFTPYLKNAFGSEIYQTRGIAIRGDKMLVASVVQSSVVDLKTGTTTPFGNWAPGGAYSGWPLFVNAKGAIWGWARNQICRMDSLGNRIEQIPLPEEGVSGRVWALMQDRDQTWWIGPNSAIVQFNKATDERPRVFQKYNGFESLRTTFKWHFLDSEVGIWISSNSGLYLLDREKGIVARFASDETGNRYLPADRFIYSYKDKEGILWLSTESSGLLRIDEGELINTPQDTQLRVQQFTRLDGLPSNELYSIFEDDHQHLWISSANGLVQFDKKTFSINSYFEEHGITNNEFNRISQFKDDSGRMYFGGLNGVTAFHPDDFYGLPPYNPKLCLSYAGLFSGKTDSLTEITAQVLAGKPITFLPGDKYLDLKFALQDYFYSDQLEYNYWIEGVNKTWVPLNGNQLQLSNLPYGKYQLKVRGRGPDKRYSLSELSIPLSFPKPFYLQYWFLITLLLAIGLSAWQISYWRIHSLRKQQVLLEEMVRERTEKIRKDKQLIEEQAEQLQELDQLKSRFFANISHELRTPLTLILGPLESVLKRNRLENRDFTYLKLMQQNGELLLKRIDELLQLSRIEAKKVAVKPVPVTLYDFLKRMLAGFEGGANLKQVSLLFDFQTDRDLKVLLDTDKVEKIVTNYLSNAIKFTLKEGEIGLTVTRQANQLQIAVRDTGIGIPPEDLEHVFDRFFQSSNNDQHGTGIGLSLCRELAQLMDGKVWVESAQGQGSTFYLELPLIETFEKEASSPTPPVAPVEAEGSVALQPESNKGYGKYSILVVEDNASLRDYISLILADYHVLTAEHGARALEILRTESSIDLILSDIMMPVMDGLELLETVKGDDELCHTPMIMLTAKQSLDTKLQALRIGVDDYMVKPFKEDELLARVANLLRNRANQPASSSESEDAPTKVSPADLRWLEEIEQHILKNLGSRSFNLSRLADDMLMSTRRLQQKIKAITGLTPKQYQREIQLEQARRLLESGAFQTVAEVSYKVGFEDPHYFSTLFQQRYGKKPSEY